MSEPCCHGHPTCGASDGNDPFHIYLPRWEVDHNEEDPWDDYDAEAIYWTDIF